MPINNNKPIGNIKVPNAALNKSSKAVLPDGRIVSREEILEMLNLDSTVAADGWLNAVACGINAAGLRSEDARVLVEKNIINKELLTNTQLEAIKNIRK